MSAGGVTFQLKSIIAVITATFATQERRHAWASPASLVCLLLWIIITTGLILYYRAFLLRRAIPSVVTVVVPTLAWALVVYNEGFDIGRAFCFLPTLIEFGLVFFVVSQKNELSRPSRNDDRVSSKIRRSAPHVFVEAPNAGCQQAGEECPEAVIEIGRDQHLNSSASTNPPQKG
ncbi:hypothetical protein CcaCcLH18_03041 [Colletotrichum camelliae]|nr:hypothetical protein CcaCcLH18_03041 [Colletotrichum camelliae]